MEYTTKIGKYEKHRHDMAGVARESSAAGRDIAPLPKVKNPRRKKKCAKSLRLFCETYLDSQFPLDWSTDHITAIDRLQTTVLDGGQFAFAMPRGSGKTTLSMAAAMWACLYAHRHFVVLIGATEPHAEELLDSIRSEFETNDLLLDDFPEVCYPIRRLDGIVHRCNGQTLNGERTKMSWKAKEMVFPTIKKAKTSGIVLRVAGITGRVRGMKSPGPDGSSIRPDLVIVDDPQTDESARSLTQNDSREKVMTGAVLGLAGPKTKIAAVMPCTVIAPGDMADRTLDRDRNPTWHGERMKMVYSFPTDEKLWDEYARIRRDSLQNGGSGAEATEFYRLNREKMDAGAMVGWEERYNIDELSALQHAMNIRIDKPAAFAAEYQNEPIADNLSSGLPELTPDALVKRLNGLPVCVVPRECDRVTAFVDVGGKVHWYAVVAWNSSFGGSVIDYGPWPRQNRAYFAASDARPDLEALSPGAPEPARVYAGLSGVVNAIAGREYEREGGGGLKIERLLIDSGWLPDTVFRFCRENPHSAILLPSKGYSVGAAGRQMSEWAVKPGERVGWNWRITPVTGGGRGRLCVFDPNIWKTFAVDRFLAPMGAVASVTLHGKESHNHQLLADHLTAEFRVRTEGRGRQLDEWSMKPGRVDNHLFDCFVGAAVAANVQGLAWQAGSLAGQVVTPAIVAAPRSTERKHITPGQKHITAGKH